MGDVHKWSLPHRSSQEALSGVVPQSVNSGAARKVNKAQFSFTGPTTVKGSDEKKPKGTHTDETRVIIAAWKHRGSFISNSEYRLTHSHSSGKICNSELILDSGFTVPGSA